jgi:1-carboxybiuret hydrolase subunit AtzG-like protein
MTRKPAKLRKKSSALPHARKGAGASSKCTPEKHDPLDDVIEENALSLGIKIDKAWKPAIRANLMVTLRHGAFVTAFAMDDEAEPAPVFEP